MKIEQKGTKSMSTKDIEKMGTEAFIDKIKTLLGNDYDLDDIRNKGQKATNLGCDLILTVHGKEYFIELKTSKKSKLPPNIRFTHQTLSKMHNNNILKDMIVVFVYNLENGKENAKFIFHKFGDIDAKNIIVEPHFIIRSKHILAQVIPNDDSFRSELENVICSTPKANETNYREIFDKKVNEWMSLKKG